MNRHAFFVLDGAELIDGLADHVHHAAERAPAHGDGNRPALIDGVHAAHHAFGGFHRDATYAAFAEVLLHFENHVDGSGHGKAVAHDSHGLINRRQVAFVKLHVDGRPRNLNHMSDVLWHKSQLLAARSWLSLSRFHGSIADGETLRIRNHKFCLAGNYQP